MPQIPTYRLEREAGLGAVLNGLTVAHAPVMLAVDRPEVPEGLRRRLTELALERSKAAVGDFDLHPLSTILVTTGWNKNDDVFEQGEVWMARATPEDKPFNYEHQCDQIIGHIIANWPVSEDGTRLADDTALDSLPDRYSLLTSAVLYKYWEKPELQQRMDSILEGIAKAEWFVSMECLFKGFDYALKAKDGTSRVVARNTQTAFLTKHLRAYGGNGVYGEYRVGRLLRNIVFSGKGLVKNPANPESIILSSSAEAFRATAVDFSTAFGSQVYPSSGEHENPQEESKNIMATENLEKQLADLKADNDRLRAEAIDSKVGEHKTRAEKAEGAKKEADGLLAKATESLKTLEDAKAAALKEVEALKAKLAENEQNLTEVRKELKELYDEQKKVARIATAKDKLKLSDADATEFVSLNSDKDDATFTKAVEFQVKAMTAWTTNNPQDGNTNFNGGAKPKPAPKQTPAQDPPQSTNKPVPMHRPGFETTKSDVETDTAGEQTAAETDLSKVQGQTDAALSTTPVDSGVSEVQKAIAAYFGHEVEEGDNQ